MSDTTESRLVHVLERLVEKLDSLEARLERIEERLNPAEKADEPAPIVLDEPLQTAFLTWSREEKRNSPKWLGDQRRYLAWWGENFAGKDLRTLDLARDVLPHLDTAPGGRTPRIAVLKAFYGWLRQVRHALDPSEDPTLNRLAVPQAKPAQLTATKATTREDFLAARRHLESRFLDVLDVLAGTGWHVSEVERFARRGELELKKGRRVVVCPSTKNGERLRTQVSQAVFRAATRLRNVGKFNVPAFRRALVSASAAAGVPTLKPGSFRHSVATFAVDQGADLGTVADFLGHKSPATTRRFYATHATPAKVPTLR